MSKVKLEIGEIARIRLNRPEKKNALDLELLTELRDAVKEVANSDAKVAVLSGEGDTFCAGLDRNLLFALTQQDIGNLSEAIDFVQDLIYSIRTLKMPVIAAVQRYAIGGGLQLALAADIRIATPGTVFSVREPDYAIIPDMGALSLLPRLVGDGVAREMVFMRKDMTAEEGKTLGLVNEIYEDLEKGIEEYTQKILSVPPHVFTLAKEVLERSWTESFAENLKSAKEAQIKCVEQTVKLFRK
ncbi:enoyl-CoA hydratase/isomerase family protein [Archaeoglobus sp.]